MEQRFSLGAAGKLFGISANAMRARVKKTPEKYRMERDNGGKIWLWIDPESLPMPQRIKSNFKPSTFDELKASIDAMKDQTELRERLATETARANAAEAMLSREQEVLKDALADRDRWYEAYQEVAQKGDPTLLVLLAALLAATFAAFSNGMSTKDSLQGWISIFLGGVFIVASVATAARIRGQIKLKEHDK